MAADGNYAFICHANQDKHAIDRVDLVRLLTREAVRLVIDRATAIDVGDLPHLVHTFRGGKKWRRQIEALADRAGCVLVLWSRHMKDRIESEPGGGWIGYEILTGLRNGTAFFCCLDGETSPDEIYDALSSEIENLERFKTVIEAEHILPLRSPTANREDGRVRIDYEMKRLAEDVYRKIDVTRLGRLSNQLDPGRINRLLNLVDREDAVERIVQGNAGIVHLAYGANPECRLEDLIQRLKDVELPWLRGSIERDGINLLDWRTSIVAGADAKPWVACYIDWPGMTAPTADDEDMEAAVRIGANVFLRRLAARIGLLGTHSSDAEMLRALKTYISDRPDCYLCVSSVDDQPANTAYNAKMVDRLPTLLRNLPSDKVRIVLSAQQERPKRRLFFFTRDASTPLKEAAARQEALILLGNVRRDELHNWAALAETVVDQSFNTIVDFIRDIYSKFAPSGGQPEMPMNTLRESLQRLLAQWRAKGAWLGPGSLHR